MVEFSVILKRFEGSNRPDVCVFINEDRELAIEEMRRYCKKNGFTVQDKDGRFTIKTILLVEKEPIYGSPVISEIPYHKIFDHLDNRREPNTRP